MIKANNLYMQTNNIQCIHVQSDKLSARLSVSGFVIGIGKMDAERIKLPNMSNAFSNNLAQRGELVCLRKVAFGY